MSIPVLTQVYDEARRLAVAGSVVAHGDFRLKKLLPPLDQAGAKAPVFAKVAEAARAVVDGSEDASANNLLELTSLVTAVLYTQGETGAPGELVPLETVDLGGTAAQTSARLLKPLLEALSSTGSGRLELIKEAHQRGAFRDLRLVKPALDGLDDPYAEVADFLAEEVLPLYGKAILPELRAKYDPKGTKGHPRRLKLLFALDPAGAREFVTQALESGSKEVKVAAIGLLGTKEDLPFLIEQAAAKAQDVRDAAYRSLARIDSPAAVAVLEKALAGKDLDLVTRAVSGTGRDETTAMLVAEAVKERAALTAAKDKKAVSESARRLAAFVGALPRGEHPAADALTLDLFARRAELAKAKGETQSGADVVEAVIRRMADGPKPLKTTLARAHAELDPTSLPAAFHAGREVLTPAQLYDLFSPYLSAGAKAKGPAKAARDALEAAFGAGSIYYWHVGRSDDGPPLDPRWLDLAVETRHLGLVFALARPGHPAAQAFARSEFDAALKAGRDPNRLHDTLAVLVRLRHPDAADALIAAYEKTAGKANAPTYWYHQMIPELPKEAVPKLEAVLPKLKDREADHWLAAIQELRSK